MTRPHPKHPTLVCLSVACLLAALPAPPAAAMSAGSGLLDLSLEELLHVEITSASKKTQTIAETAAAAFVITQDDIRRTGARSIPDVLRLVPGLEVAQIDGNKWAVSARGFNGRFANKLLVLMDGRALYTPSFGGVFWDVQDTLLQDIERIEVIRGPGGAIWGANAVNGVINIITRSSKDTQSVELTGDADNHQSHSGSLRFGGTPRDNLSYRLYGKYTETGGNRDIAGNPTADSAHLARFGVRGDWTPTPQDALFVTAEGYHGGSGETLTLATFAPPYATIENSTEEVTGFFTNARWQRRLTNDAEVQAQVYFDSTERTSRVFSEARDTAFVEMQYHSRVGDHQDFVAGAGYRHNRYSFQATDNVTVAPPRPSDSGFNVFLQDEIQLLPSRLALTLGVDLEHNPLSEHDLDTLPSARLLWSVNDKNHLWLALTRAISTPTYEQTSASVRNAAPLIPPGNPANPFPVPIQTSFISNAAIQSERLTAYELGYRTQVSPSITLDITAFRHNYQKLRGEQTRDIYCAPSGTSIFLDPACVLNADAVVNLIQFQNDLAGRSTGLEVAAEWAPRTGVRFSAAYTFLDLNIEAPVADASLLQLAAYTMGQSPKHQLHLRGDLALSHAVDLNVSVRYTDTLHAIPINAYWSADATLIWHASRQWELALTGRNLLQSAHAEFVSELQDVVPTQIERAIGADVRWTF